MAKEKLIEWEVSWIRNSNLYEGKFHKASVIENIKKRYEIIELQNKIKVLKENK